MNTESESPVKAKAAAVLGKPNPSLYRELNVPFPSIEAANQSLVDFQEELGELRKKYRIADLTVIFAVSVKHEGEEGGERLCIADAHFGAAVNQELMLAKTLGWVRRQRDALIAKISGEPT